MRSLWRRWLHTAQRIVAFFADIVLAALYLLVIIPVGILLQRFAPDRLSQSTRQSKKTTWISYPKKKFDMDFAKRQ